MTDKVVPLNVVKREHAPDLVPVKRILEEAGTEKLTEVVILGMTEDGNFYSHTNVSNTDCYWLTGVARKRLMGWALYEDDD